MTKLEIVKSLLDIAIENNDILLVHKYHAEYKRMKEQNKCIK